jgi:hypothetical protein
MNVYVETNFILEHALEQEEFESCRDFLALSSAHSIQLIIPAFSLAEPHDVLRAKEKARHKIGNDLKTQLNELGRSKQYSNVPMAFSELTAIFFASGENERRGLHGTIQRMVEDALIIPLDSAIFEWAVNIETGFGLSSKDSIVLASILKHLNENTPQESCFLNRNTKDFDDPDIKDILDRLKCKFFGSFDEGLRYVKSRLESA